MKPIIEKWWVVSVAGMAAFITPIKADLWLVGGLVMADWITGTLKGIKTKTFSSVKAIRKYWVSAGYIFAIFIARSVEMYFNNAIPIVKPMVVIIAISELQSLRENIKVLTGIDLLSNVADLFKKKAA